jgi:hypothetical protein
LLVIASYFVLLEESTTVEALDDAETRSVACVLGSAHQDWTLLTDPQRNEALALERRATSLLILMLAASKVGWKMAAWKL